LEIVEAAVKIRKLGFCSARLIAPKPAMVAMMCADLNAAADSSPRARKTAIASDSQLKTG
jgi:hypothetical protein